MAAGDYYELGDRQTHKLIITFTNFKKALRFVRDKTTQPGRSDLVLSKLNRDGRVLQTYFPEELEKLIAQKLAWAEVMDQVSANILGDFDNRREALRFIIDYLSCEDWANLSVFECDGFGEIVGRYEDPELTALLNKLVNQSPKTSG
jgi:hypothetical protein